MAVSIPRKGTYVSELSLKDFTEVSQTREMIECYSMELLKASDVRDLPNAEQALREAAALQSRSDSRDEAALIRKIKVMHEFHISLVEATGNSMLSKIYDSIGYTLTRYQYIYFHIDDAARHSLEDHNRVLALVREGNFD